MREVRPPPATTRTAAALCAVLALASACGGTPGSPSLDTPAILEFSAARATVTAGQATTLTATFTGGAGSIDPGVGAVESGVPVGTGPLPADTTFTLTVVNGDRTAWKVLGVAVAPAPATPVLTAPLQVTAGATGTASVAAQAGMTFSWIIGGGTLAGGGTTATGASVSFVAGTGGTLTLTCTATNAAGDSAASAVSIEVLAAPAAPAIAAPTTLTVGSTGAASVAPQAGVTFSWTISGGTFAGGGTTAAGTSVSFVAGAVGELVLACSARNAAGAVASSSAPVQVTGAPGAPAITAPAYLTAGTTGTASAAAQAGMTFSWTITGGTFAGGGVTATGMSVSFAAGGVGNLVLGCTARNAAGDFASSSTAVQVVPTPAPPAITAPTSVATGATGVASVASQAGMTFSWTITGGTFTGGGATATGPSVSFVAGGVGDLVLACSALNAAGATASSTATVQIVEAPGTPVITAPAYVTSGDTATASVAAQAGTTYSWTIAGGAFAGGGTSATGTSVSFAAGGVGTLVLACSGQSAGGSSSSTATVQVVAAPAAPVITAPASVTTGATGAASAADQAGTTFSWTVTGGTFAGGGTSATGASASFVAGAVGSLVLTCVARNAAGTVASSSAAVQVAAVPATPTIFAAAYLTTGTTGTASVVAQAGMTFSWTITGGTLAGGGTTAAGTSVTFAAGGVGNLVLGCTARNAAGDSASSSTTVQVVAAPGVTGFSSTLAAVAPGSGTTLAAVFSGGTGTVDHGVGQVQSGALASTGPLYATTTFTLTVVNAAGSAATAQTTVRVLPAGSVITFTTEGASFAPVIVRSGPAQVTWTFDDGTTSSSDSPTKLWDSAATRQTTLQVTPWSAVTRINVGYDGGDGGDTVAPALEHVPDQQVSAVQGLELVAPTLRQWCSSYNQLTSLDFGSFTQLERIEAFHSATLSSVNLQNTPALTRVCFEAAGLTALDVSGSPALADLRAAVNPTLPTIGFGAGTFPATWHVCTRDNPQIVDQALYSDTGRFPNLSELWIWNDNQAGALRIPSSSPTDYVNIVAHLNQYTSADLRGALLLATQDGIVDLAQNALTHVDLTGCVQITELYLAQNALPQPEVDRILLTLDGFPAHSPAPAKLWVDLTGGTSAAPSATGVSAAASLRAKGWTVVTN